MRHNLTAYRSCDDAADAEGTDAFPLGDMGSGGRGTIRFHCFAGVFLGTCDGYEAGRFLHGKRRAHDRRDGLLRAVCVALRVVGCVFYLMRAASQVSIKKKSRPFAGAAFSFMRSCLQ